MQEIKPFVQTWGRKSVLIYDHLCLILYFIIFFQPICICYTFTICLNSNFLTNNLAIQNESMWDVPQTNVPCLVMIQHLLFRHLCFCLFFSFPIIGLLSYLMTVVPESSGMIYSMFPKHFSILPILHPIWHNHTRIVLVGRDVNKITFNVNLTHICHCEA